MAVAAGRYVGQDADPRIAKALLESVRRVTGEEAAEGTVCCGARRREDWKVSEPTASRARGGVEGVLAVGQVERCSRLRAAPPTAS